MKKENVVILGSTGSIGTQAIEVLETVKDKNIIGLSANNNIDLLLKQVRKIKPKYVAIFDEEKAQEFKNCIKQNIKIFTGLDGLCELAQIKEADLVINAVSGVIGIKPTIAAVKDKKILALANKEALCCEGKKIMSLVKKYNVDLRPIDSEHSAIWQCLQGEDIKRVKKLIITCSGGPFYKKKKADLENVTIEDCLKHPTWSMGKKITIDSATLANKGLEVMEAHYLFGIKPENIDVVIQRESIIHSMVLFKDGSVKAQLGVPSMKIPISYAIYKEKRPEIKEKELDFSKLKCINIDIPDNKTFKCIELAKLALKKGGRYPKKFCEADEIAVKKYLNGEIKFTEIEKFIEKALK